MLTSSIWAMVAAAAAPAIGVEQIKGRLGQHPVSLVWCGAQADC